MSIFVDWNESAEELAAANLGTRANDDLVRRII